MENSFTRNFRNCRFLILPVKNKKITAGYMDYIKMMKKNPIWLLPVYI